MTYAAYESSIEQGRPVRLYRFALNGKEWYFTSADSDQLRMNKVWKAVTISDAGTSATGQATQDTLTVVAPSWIEPADIFAEYPPSHPMTLAIFETHYGDNEVVAIYLGEVTAADNSRTPGATEFTIEDLSTTTDRAGLRFVWQRGCNYAVYDPATCKVDKNAYLHSGTVTAVDGNEVQVNGMSIANGYLDGGFMEWDDTVRGLELRAVESQTGGTLVMFGSADGIEVGMTVRCYPGCARTSAACAGFNNLPNYGGVPGMQGESPFDGTPVFY